MTDLISRQAALDIVFDFAETPHRMYQQIRDLPTIDAVPVTRCRDCEHRKAKMRDCYGNGLVLCNDGVWRDMEFFCADGERSE